MKTQNNKYSFKRISPEAEKPLQYALKSINSFGIALSFAYILFMRFATMFALRGGVDPFLAVWIPNMIFVIIALPLYRFAPK